MPPQQPLEQKLAEHHDWDDDDVSDGQMQRLLQQAQQRLSKNAVHHRHITEAAVSHDVFKLNPGFIAQPYIASINGVARADPCRLLSDKDRRLSNKVKTVEDPVKLKEKAAKLRSQTLASHFGMPRTNMDNALKTDLSLLKLRGVLDPKHHYKKESSKGLISEFSEVGKIVEGPLEYKSRLPNRDRKRTFVEEVLANESSTGRFKDKYNEIQSFKTSGKKAHYQNLKSKRSGGIRKR